jgi:hypothetical protein
VLYINILFAVDVVVPGPSSQATDVTSVVDPSATTEEATVHSEPKTKAKKATNVRNLYGLRKRLIDIEEKRVEEVKQLKVAIQESNAIQKERNEILKQLLGSSIYY